MFSRSSVTTTFEPERTIQPIYTGGDVALDKEGRILATCLGEEALVTDLGTGELLVRIEGDGEVLTALSITPSASHLILCSRSLSMKIYALQSSEDLSHSRKPVLLKTLKPHTTPVITAAVDGTGTLIATGGADGVIKVWDIKGGYLTHTFRGHAGVISALHFFQITNPRPGNAISVRIDNKSRKQTNELQDRTAQNAMVDDHPTNKIFHLASGSEDGKIRIWNLGKRKSMAILDSHVSVVRDLNFLEKENLLVSGSRDKTVILWDAQSWKAKKVVPILEGVEATGFLCDGAFIYTGGESGKLRIWETKTGREITQEQEIGGEGDGIVHICHNLDLDFLLCVHADQSLNLHSTASLSNLRIAGGSIDPLPIIRRISGTHDEIIDLAYVTPDRALLALATNSENIRLVSLATASTDTNTSSSAKANYFGADVALLEGHEDIILCLDVDWSGCWLATGAKDNTARLWRIDHARNSYQHFATFTGHAESLGAISLPSNPPPTGLAAHNYPLDHAPPFLLTGSQDRTIKRWNITKLSSSKQVNRPSPRALYTRKAHDKDINALSTNHTSTLFASASQDRTVKIWSVEEGEVQGVLRGHRRGVWSVKFAPKDYPSITGDNTNSTGPASASRGLVLTGSGDKTIKIWSLTDYSCLRTLEGHTNSVLKVLWMPLPSSPSSDPTSTLTAPTPQKRPLQIASAGGDGLVKIWDANTGETAATLDNHTDRIWALTVDPTTNTLVSGGGDSNVTFWKDTSSATVAAAVTASTRAVEQEQDLMNYIHAGNYREAITLALALDHPQRLLALFQSVVSTSPAELGSISGLHAVDAVLCNLGDEQLLVLFRRIRDWNTNARTAGVAQRILNVLVRGYGMSRLAGIRGRGWRELVEGVRAYTERHYRRVEGLVDESFLVEFVLGEMETVAVGVGVDGDGIGERDVVMV